MTTRDQRRSLALGHAVADKLAADPPSVVSKAKSNIEHLRSVHPRGRVLASLDEWAKLLDGPIEDIRAALTADTEHGRELRQNTPFAGVLTLAERSEVLASFERVSALSL